MRVVVDEFMRWCGVLRVLVVNGEDSVGFESGGGGDRSFRLVVVEVYRWCWWGGGRVGLSGFK